MTLRTPPWRMITKKYALLAILSWTVLIFLSLSWNSRIAHENHIEKARVEARTFFELNLAYRRWGSLHGGVYVGITDKLQPNPYLQVPDRDVTTTTGRKLTLVNPAWMTRQVFEMLGEQSRLPILSRLVSIDFLNPVNKPDAWEEASLRSFEQGEEEASVIATIGTAQYMRVMKPFRTEASCITCHGTYKIGSIRGGISVAVPLQPHLATEAHEQRAIMVSHVFFWFIGAGGIVLFTRRVERHQRQIIESEEKYRILFESNPHPMWVYDLETLRFLAVNDAAEKHYGYSRDEFLSMSIRNIRPAEDVPALLENVSRVTTGLDKAGTWRHLRKDGSQILVEITSHTVDFGGRRSEIVMANDVTERLKLEDQLRQAQKMEAVGLLAGGVAHDFNNVLTAIIGYGNLLHMKIPQDDPTHAFADNILTTAQRAAQLTQSLLAFGRRQVIKPVPIELNSIVARVTKLLQRLIREDIELNVRLTPEDTTVMADSVQIEQVLMNLVTNARDAMPRGGTLTISSSVVMTDKDLLCSHGTVAEGRYVRLAIIDTGTGMDSKTRERLFEPFFTTKELGKGTGLGLASVYGIVQQHRGVIDVESEPGTGTGFHLFFPLVKASVLRQAEPSQGTVPVGTETILVAEDDRVLRNLARSVLTEFGYSVIEAEDGEEAVRLFQQDPERIGLLLLDVIMPKKSGKSAYDEILALRPGMKVIFISGYSADILAKQGIMESEVDVIAKPISPVELLQKIRQVLDR